MSAIRRWPRRLVRWLDRRTRRAHRELSALARAMRDERTPWHAKATVVLAIGLATSPIDPIPDVIPVLGHVDDLVLVPLAIGLARRLVPDRVMADARAAGGSGGGAGRAPLYVALLVLAGWLLAVAAVAWFLTARFGLGLPVPSGIGLPILFGLDLPVG